MGTIRTNGTAYREVEYDRMEVKVTFVTIERQSKEAVRKVTEESEAFLEALAKMGIKLSSIEGLDSSVSKNFRHDIDDVSASRKISWDSAYNLRLIDYLTQLVEKGSYSVDLEIDPYFSKSTTLHKELVKEAVLDAREMAQQIADSLGVNVKGPEKININPYDKYFDEDEDEDSDSWLFAEGSYGADAEGFYKTNYSNLKTPTIIEEETVTVEWELEY